MKFNPRARLDTSEVSDTRGRSRGRTAAAGGGIGALLLVVVALLTGTDPTDILGAGDDGSQVQSGPDTDTLDEQCQVAADIDENPDCRFVLYVNSIQDYWRTAFDGSGGQYTEATTEFFTDAVDTACGTASSQVGPFYCPGDQQVYLDLGFFDVLRNQFGGSGGQFAEAYVLAHEYGHHVQNLTGQMQQVQPGSGPDSDAVRLELQADCYAGVWANHATRTPDESGNVLITELSEQDIRDGLDAARIVGDDYIQERFQGTVSPESWTHGSSEQRQQWFMTGFQSGDPGTCDTFGVSSL
ncbi:MAG TPA: neutral zinc metallopeptidase [Jiangellaceae bacterium]|nr:neutral zinc metallopeptidase [Jiangellaceae bacterium]